MYASLLSLGLVVFASTQTATVARRSWTQDIHLSTSFESIVGSGSFVANSKSDDPYYGSTLSISPSWALSEHLSVIAGLSFMYEWTAMVTPCHPASNVRPASAPQNDCSDTNDANAKRFDWTNLHFSLEHDELYKTHNISFSGGAGISLPTRRESLASKNILALDVTAVSSSRFGPIQLTIGLGASKNFSQAKAASLDAVETHEKVTPIAYCPTYLQTNCILLSGFVPNWQFNGELGTNVDIKAVKGLSAGLGFSYAYSTRHSKSPDQFSSKSTDSEGKSVVDGSNASDVTGGYFELSYEISKQWSIAGGVSSMQPVRTEDGQHIRFPFYDFLSPANNYSGFYLRFGNSI